jgi:hypothetical protein
MKKREITLREHLSSIQSKGGKARWAKLSPEERSAQARKAIAARWAKGTAKQRTVQARTTAAGRPPSKKSANSDNTSTDGALFPKAARKKLPGKKPK